MAKNEFESMDDHDIINYAMKNYQNRREIQVNNSALYDRLMQNNLLKETFPQEERSSDSNIGDLVKAFKRE
jgi:hypothetical protein